MKETTPNAEGAPLGARDAIVLQSSTCAPGSMLRGTVRLAPGDERYTELSVVWETSGKGDKDIQTILERPLDPRQPEHGFEVQLPVLPLSYDGEIVKISWRVRLKRMKTQWVFGDSDDQLSQPFWVGWPP